MLVCFDIVWDLEGLDVSDDSFGWFDEVASRRSVSLDALALCQCIASFDGGIGSALTPLRI